MMTGHGDVPLAVEAMKLGAVDFLEKPFEDDRLIAMIETAMRQAEPAAEERSAIRGHRRPRRQPEPARAAGMEGLVAGHSNKAIAREYDISPRTVEVYRANVMTKMQAGNLSELVRFAIRAGMLKIEPRKIELSQFGQSTSRYPGTMPDTRTSVSDETSSAFR